MSEILSDNNVVEVMGKIVSQVTFSHEVYGEGFYSFTIEAARLSDNADLLPVTISERLIDKELLTMGTVVDIKGQLRSYNNYNNKKNKLVLTIFVRQIEIIQEQVEINPNQIFLNGYICKPPIYRVTPFGREIADILVAVNRAYNKSDYIPCIAWGRNAKFAGNLKVGENIKLWGRIQSRKYQKKNGEDVEEKIAYEVSISKLDITENKQKDDDSTQQAE